MVHYICPNLLLLFRDRCMKTIIGYVYNFAFLIEIHSKTWEICHFSHNSTSGKFILRYERREVQSNNFNMIFLLSKAISCINIKSVQRVAHT